MNILQPKNFEVPTCSICMDELTDSLSVTSCGHVFHAQCILQSLEHKGQCPNCRTRNTTKQLKELNFTINVIKAADQDRIQFFDSLKQADQENYLKLIAQNEEMYKELEVTKKKVSNLKEELANKESLLASQGEMIRIHNKERAEVRVEKQSLQIQKESAELENQKLTKEAQALREMVDKQAKQIKEAERLKKLFDSSGDNEDEFLKSLREKGSAQEQARTFYEFLRIKKLDLKKAKEETQRLAIELAKYKGKGSSQEISIQKKVQLTKNYDRESNRMEIQEDSRSFGQQGKMNFDKIKKAKTQEPLPLPSLLKTTTSTTSSKENINEDDVEFKFLEEEIRKSSLVNVEKAKTAAVESIQVESSSRVIRNLILPKGINKVPQGISKPISAFTSQKSSQPENNNMTNKDVNSFSLKRIKLNSEDFSLKSSNVQQKLSLFKGSNH